MFDKILDINECFLQNEISNKIRLKVKAYAIDNNYSFYDVKSWTGLLRNLIIRTSSLNELMIIMVFNEDDKEKITSMMNFIKEEFPEITSLNYVVNNKKMMIFRPKIINFSGRDHISMN